MNQNHKLPPHSTLVEILRWRSQHQPDRHAYTYLKDGEIEKDRVSYAQLDRKVRSVAAALQDYGAANERVLLLLPPGIDYIVGFFGCLYAGATAVPMISARSHAMTAISHRIYRMMVTIG